MLVRITVNVLRISGVLALILGIVLWISNNDALNSTLIAIHAPLGILVTLSLWVLGYAIGTTRGGNWGLAAGAFVIGLLVTGLGLSQMGILPDSSVHWIVQVVHLLFGLAAIGMGEMIAGRYKRLNVATQTAR